MSDDLCKLLGAVCKVDDLPPMYPLRLRDFAQLQRHFEAEYRAIVTLASGRISASSGERLMNLAEQHIAAGAFAWGGEEFSAGCLSAAGFMPLLTAALRGFQIPEKRDWRELRRAALTAAGFVTRSAPDDDTLEPEKTSNKRPMDWRNVIKALRRKSNLTLAQIGELTQEQLLFELSADGSGRAPDVRRTQFKAFDKIRAKYGIPLHRFADTPADKLAVMIQEVMKHRGKIDAVRTRAAVREYIRAVRLGTWRRKV